MNKQETALIRKAMKALVAEMSGSYGLGYPSARRANQKVLDVLAMTATTWTLIDWHEGKQVHPVMGFGESLTSGAYLLQDGWQKGLWSLCHQASKGKGIIMDRIDYAARNRVIQLGALYNACQMALDGEYGLGASEWARITGYLKAEWPVSQF